ncbi:MAG: hypothetical protein A2174_02345 [Candidatus Portnoybacteria bacterium RBG_13_41_18]|uniref:Glycosyl transferase family 1 domain-containing protein n=1 Tax=Candidatus Portnoybacteria bacterium RBG_13_41_18 TaxID=1801991 RepID=A0A1G2FB23_9BACT|nr:MAG: hypothetical protein A2174_02345 [Candidatus Portnoybacteria bacterium RBG_13_41_18]
MKINFLLPKLKISGGTRVILTYADLLAKKGYKVTVLVQSKNWTRPFFNFLKIKPRWFGSLCADVWRVQNWSASFVPDADILVADTWKLALIAADLPDEKGKKFHFVQHDERLYHGSALEVAKAYQLPFKKIVVSSWLREILKNDFDFEPELLINTVDRNLFYPVPVKKNESEIKILLLEHDYDWKGTKEGVDAVKKIKEKNPNVKLVLFSARKSKTDFPCDEYYYNLPQKKLAWLYSSCDIFLCPSWDEGFGLPSLEAMACGCAIVTYDNGGSRDFAFDPHAPRGVGVDGQTALVARRRDTEDLYQKLEILAADKNLREKIAQNGYDFALKMPTWEEQAKKLEKILLGL